MSLLYLQPIYKGLDCNSRGNGNARPPSMPQACAGSNIRTFYFMLNLQNCVNIPHTVRQVLEQTE